METVVKTSIQIPHYQVKQIIGQGGMATVYRAEHAVF
jgi:hypothetical protein